MRVIMNPADMAQKGLDLAREALSRRIASIFKETWGDDWLQNINAQIDKYNEKMRREKNGRWADKVHIVPANNGAKWDFSAMLYALSDNIDSIPPLQHNAFEIKNAATSLIKYARNTLAHKHDDFDSTNKEFAVKNLQSALRLMEKLGCTENVDEIGELIRFANKGSFQLLDPDQINSENGHVGKEDIREVRAMLEELLGRKDKPSSLEAKQLPSEIPQVASGALDALDAEITVDPVLSSMPKPIVLGQRKNSILDPKDGVVLFPIVLAVADADKILPDAGDIGYVLCKCYEPKNPPNDNYSCVTGAIDRAISNLYNQIIGDARWSEDDSNQVTRHTQSRINPNDVSGSSFGLAVAIADRSARYGFSKKLAGRQIIATGTIERAGQGAVSAVDGFEAKVRLIERKVAESVLAKGALFIFPKANWDSTDEATRELLEQAKASGRLMWQAIKHIDDLKELFAGATHSATHGATDEHKHDLSQPQRLSDHDIKPELEGEAVAKPSQQPSKVTRKNNTGLSKYVAVALVLGSALLFFAWLFAEFWERNKLDPALIQASDERLKLFGSLGERISDTPSEAALCRDILTARAQLTDIDRTRMLAGQRYALSAAERCATALRESDQRWDTLTREANAARISNAAAPDSLAQARAGLTPFDLSRQSEANNRALLAQGDEAVTRVNESDRRWLVLTKAVAQWRMAQSGAALDAIVTAWSSLNSLDLQRIVGERVQAAETARALVAESKASDARFNNLMKVVAALRNDNSAINRNNIEQALLSLTAFDRSRASSEQRAVITDAQALSNESAQSDARLRDLVQSHKQLETAEAARRNILAASTQLLNRAGQITARDKSLMNVEQKAALARADQVQRDFAASDTRINEAIRWAEIGLTNRANGWTNAATTTAIQRSRTALNRLDRERLSSDQRSLLDRVCGVKAPTTSDTLAPLDLCIPISGAISPPVLSPIAPAPAAAEPAAALTNSPKPDDDIPRKVTTFGDWGVYATQNGNDKICYAMSQPLTRTPKNLLHEKAFIFVSNRPAENVRGEISIVMGFAVESTPAAPAAKGEKANPQSFIEISSSKLALIGRDNKAFLQNVAQESQLVDLMGKTSEMVIHIASIYGNEIVYNYSLLGFALAYDRVKKDCP